MSAEVGLFYVFAGIVLGSALLVVVTRNMVRAIFLFFVTLFAIAGLYIFALADFIALTQVVVYAGGVLVLMLFAFMLSDKELLNKTTRILAKDVLTFNRLAAIAVAAGFLVVLFRVIAVLKVTGTGGFAGNSSIEASTNTIPLIGVSLMTRYLLPFEVASIFLLMVLIGAVHLSRKERSA